MAKGQVKARVLVDCEHGKSNDVVTLDATVAAAAQKAGIVDTDSAAVAYAEGKTASAEPAAETSTAAGDDTGAAA